MRVGSNPRLRVYLITAHKGAPHTATQNNHRRTAWPLEKPYIIASLNWIPSRVELHWGLQVRVRPSLLRLCKNISKQGKPLPGHTVPPVMRHEHDTRIGTYAATILYFAIMFIGLTIETGRGGCRTSTYCIQTSPFMLCLKCLHYEENVHNAILLQTIYKTERLIWSCRYSSRRVHERGCCVLYLP